LGLWVSVNPMLSQYEPRLIIHIFELGGTFANAIRAAIRVYRQPYYDGAPTDSMVMVLPLLITNMLATGLIAYKAWYVS